MGDFGGLGRVEVYVEADADDGVSHLVALEGVFYEEAAYLPTVDKNVVGPLDGGVKSRLFSDGLCDG